MKRIFGLLLFIGLLALPVKAQKELSNELIWFSRTLLPERVEAVRSMKDGAHFTILEMSERNTEVHKYAYKNYQKAGRIVSASELLVDGKPLQIEEYDFNADESKMLIASEIEFVYRRSYLAYYYIFDLKTKALTPLADPAKGKQMLAEFSPDGKKVAFVRDNNIFIYHLDQKTEEQVTTDGKKNEIINGTTDWVYEEEFSLVKGFYWSPASTQLAYYRFDESKVKEFSMDLYGSLYPELYTFKYPKAGEDNSKISLFFYSLSNRQHKSIALGEDQDIYIPRIKWTRHDDRLCVLRMNRLQNKLEYCLVKSNTTEAVLEPVYTETSETYVEINDDLVFLDKQDAFIRTSEKDGYNHIYLIGFDGKARQITSGRWDVVEFKGIDEKKGLLYYISAEASPMEKDLYVIGMNGSGKKKLSTRKGTNDAMFSKGMKYYINLHSDANTPPYFTLHEASGKELKVLKDNKELRNRMLQYGLSKKEFFHFVPEHHSVNKTDESEQIGLNGWMIKPRDFDPSKKYPVYLTVYGGPGRNEVNDEWDGHNYFWHQLLAQKGYIVVSVDPRGTQFRGEKFKKCTYLQLGKLETEDLIETAKYLGNLDYVDKSRIGIQGWSYGGYMTLLCLTKGADYFKAGISVAPVTNWRYYDNIYTERFMRKPQDNASGYDDNSPINHTAKLKGKLLLVHGSADDNVHFQNSMEMVNALIKSNKQFEFFAYPNRNHGIYGGNTRLHLFRMMLEFVEKNL